MAPEVMTSGEYDMTADIFSFGIVLSEVITSSEAEDVIDETRTEEFGLDLIKLGTFVDSSHNGIAKDLIRTAGHCCTLDPSPARKTLKMHDVAQLMLPQRYRETEPQFTRAWFVSDLAGAQRRRGQGMRTARV